MGKYSTELIGIRHYEDERLFQIYENRGLAILSCNTYDIEGYSDWLEEDCKIQFHNKRAYYLSGDVLNKFICKINNLDEIGDPYEYDMITILYDLSDFEEVTPELIENRFSYGAVWFDQIVTSND